MLKQVVVTAAAAIIVLSGSANAQDWKAVNGMHSQCRASLKSDAMNFKLVKPGVLESAKTEPPVQIEARGAENPGQAVLYVIRFGRLHFGLDSDTKLGDAVDIAIEKACELMALNVVKVKL